MPYSRWNSSLHPIKASSKAIHYDDAAILNIAVAFKPHGKAPITPQGSFDLLSHILFVLL